MTRHQPELSEAAMRAAEKRFPELAAKAGHAAYKSALATTGTVMVMTSDDKLVRRSADGTSIVLKSLPPSKRVKSGVVLKRAKPEAG